MKKWHEGVGRDVVRVLAVGVVALAAAFAGNRLAGADPGGRTRDALSVSGTIRGVSGTPSLRFVFHKDGSTDCTGNVAERDVQYDASNGHFSAAISISEGVCRGFFDGADVSVSVFVNDREIVHQRPVSAVPYAKYADQVGVQNDCPAGYTRDTSAMGITLCVRTIAGGRDEVVKVGNGASAFWVDRYEASVWHGDGTFVSGQQGATNNGFAELLPNGQWTSPDTRERLIAVSRASTQPTAFATWFQAHALCRAAGKHLIGREEWFAATDGMTAIDPVSPRDGTLSGVTECNTGGTGARPTGRGTACAGLSGVQDMIGNMWEWTDEWYSGARTRDADGGIPVGTWPSGYGNDLTSDVDSHPHFGAEGIPSAAIRGGSALDGTSAGVYAFMLNHPPNLSSYIVGIRCVIRR